MTEKVGIRLSNTHVPIRSRFDRTSWLVLVFGCLLILGSLGQRLYRFTLPTDGWSFETGTIGTDSQDRQRFLDNLLQYPSPIRPGDWLMEIDDEPQEAFLRRAVSFQPQPAISWKAGDSVQYTVLRDSELVQLKVPLYTWPLALTARKLFLSPEVWSALLLAGIGWVVFIQRPRHLSARALLLFSNSLGASMLSSAVVSPGMPELLVSRPFPWIAMFYSNLIFATLMMPSALLLALSFPHPKSWVRRHLVLVCGLLYGTIPTLWLIAGYDHIATIGWVSTLVFLLLTAITLGHTFFTAHGTIEQAQIRWAVFGLIAAIITLVVAALAGLGVLPSIPAWLGVVIFSLGFSFASIGFGVAILQYHLYDIELVINRALVYTSLTISVASIYILIVGYLGMLFQNQGSLWISLLATAVVAVLFDRLRRWIQQIVNHLMYGERDEPYELLTRLGRQLESSLNTSTGLALTVETVANALKLPYVALVLSEEEGGQVAAQYGEPQNQVTKFPLVVTGLVIGDLRVATRSQDESFSQNELRLMGNLARQISATAHAHQLGLRLEQARLRLVTERGEARKQLGRDLHDDVGHQLTGLVQQVEYARGLIRKDPSGAELAFSTFDQQVIDLIGHVRGLAHQLFPPELELLGLAGALRERTLSHPNLRITFEVAEDLPILPAEIETVVYYITLEALTNIEKHAQAQNCHIDLRMNSSLLKPFLQLTICDNGRGLAEPPTGGIGLLSMQARAAEVGGTLTIDTRPGEGTTISVRIPYPIAIV